MKKALAMILALMLAFAFTGCGDKNTPETAVDNLFTAVKAFDTEAMNGALSAGGQGDLSGSEEFTETSENSLAAPFIDYLKGNAQKITYEIESSKVDGDTATVTVKCKYVDGSGLFAEIIQELFTKAMAAAFGGQTLTDADMEALTLQILNDKIASAEETFVEKTIDIACVKEDGTWVVKEMNEDLADVLTSNFLTGASELENLFGE